MHPAADESCARRVSRRYRGRALLAILGLLAFAAWGAEDPLRGMIEQGTRLMERGRFEEAAALWQKTADTLPATERRLRGEALVRLAESYRYLGHLSRADSVLREALAIPELDPATQALALIMLGAVLQSGGAAEDAHKAFVSSAELARDLGRDDLRAAALNDLGNLHASLGRREEARQAYLESARLAEQAGAWMQHARSILNAAQLSLGSGETGEALRLTAEARGAIERLPSSYGKAFDLLAVAEIFQRAYERRAEPELLSASYQVLEQGLALATSLDDPRLVSYALGSTGHLYELEKRPIEAAVPTRRAIFLAQQANAPELLYRWHWQNGRLFRAEGMEAEAIAEYRRAVYNLQAVRQDMVASQVAGGVSFRTALAPLYYELSDLLLRRSKSSADPAHTQQLLVEARDVVELSKSAELQDYFQDSCVANQQARITEAAVIGKQTAVLYPIVLSDRLELLVNFSDGLKQITVPVRSEELVKRVRQFRLMLEKRTTREFLPLAQGLYDLLVRPLEAELAARGIDTLVFVPDGALRTVPMAALHDGRGFLIERYALATTPGLTLTDPQPLLARKLELLLNGLSLPVQGFSALPNVVAEIESVQELFGGRVLRDRDYLLGNLEREFGAKSYSVVHIASHGQFRSDAKQTFLLTYDGKLTMDALERLIAPSRYREQPVELLTLSACQTAAGDDRAALGLAGVAIKAGARSALASLWFINDVSSTLLVSGFYRALQTQGMTKAKALQQAQRKLIADGRFRHPGYWAPFLLIGNWL